MATSRIFAALTGLMLGATAFSAVAGGLLPTPGAAPDALLPVDQAFQLDGASRKGDALTVQWTIAPGYYLYDRQIKVTVDAPTGVALAPPTLPQGESKHDEDFGDVVIFRGVLSANFALPAKTPALRTLRVRYQGCADQGICYPPQTRLIAVR